MSHGWEIHPLKQWGADQGGLATPVARERAVCPKYTQPNKSRAVARAREGSQLEDPCVVAEEVQLEQPTRCLREAAATRMARHHHVHTLTAREARQH